MANATVVSGVPYTDAVDTSEATVNFLTDVGNCGVASVWYRFTADGDATLEFNTAGSNYDTMLALYTGTASALEPQACNDDNDTYGAQARVIWQVQAGTTYYLRVGTCCGSGEDGQVGPGGQAVFNVQVPGPPPPAYDLQLSVDPRVVLGNLPGTATVSGTVECNTNGYALISGEVRQRQGRIVVRGGGGTDLACTPGAPVPWRFGVDTGDRQLVAGKATVTAEAFGCNQAETTCDRSSLSQQVKVVRR